MPHKKQPGMHAQNLPEHPRLFLFVQAEKQPFHLSAHQRIKEVHPMASTSIREVTSQASLDEKKKLRKEFNYFDMIFYTIASYFILIPGDSTISSSTLSRATYELTVFAELGLILLLTIVCYVWGHMQASNRDVVVELHAGEADVEVQASSGE